LNEEKLCQLLANQARALRRKQPRAANHAHQLPIKPQQKLATQRVPETVAQVQTLSHVKMAEAVVRNSAPRQLMLHANHVQRVPSSKSVLQKLMAQLATAGLQVMSVANLAMSVRATGAMTAVVTRVVQSVLHMETATIVHHVAIARHTETATIVHHVAIARHTETAIMQVVQSVQTMVVVTGRRKVATAGFQVMSVAISGMKVQVVQLKRLGVHAMTAVLVTHVRLTETAMPIVHHAHLAPVMQIVLHVVLVTAKIVQRAQALAVASVIAIVRSVLHTASQIHLALKTAPQSAVGQKIAVVTLVVIQIVKKEIQTVLIAQHAMIHANQLSVAHVTQTQTRRLFSKTRFLSV
jgi:hypothetical protein